jgi:hypothetical protein
VTVTAELVATGTNVAVYADTSQPPGGFVQADYDAFAQLFDNQLFPADTMNFAGPTDIDGNGRIIVLFTPRVNELTPDGMADEEGVIAGFFHFNDLAIDLFPGTSNDGEILYMLVPDPTGVTGNVFEKSRVDSVVPPTAAHELEHCLSFGHRFITLGGGSDLGLLQDKWLEEGMAHVAEDLVDIDYGNVRRANRYMATPGSVSLKSDDTIEQRGAIFLFLRYIGDRFGEGVYRDIVQTRCRGELCVELATGVDFRQLVEEFFATLYLSQRGITSNPKFNFTSFDIQNDFAPLLITPRTIAEGSIDGLVQTMAANYYLLSGLDTPATAFRVTQSGDVRTIVVRTQ